MADSWNYRMEQILTQHADRLTKLEDARKASHAPEFVRELVARVEKLENTSVMFKYDNPMAGKVSPEGSGQIKTELDIHMDEMENLKKETRGEVCSAEPAGVWITFTLGTGAGDYDDTYPHGVYATELEALRAANLFPQVRAGFVPFGADLSSAGNQALNASRG